MKSSASGGDPLQRLRALAWLLDGAIAIPGTNWRVGLDPLVGLVPVVGDAIGGLASLYALLVAAQLGAPQSVLARMVLNVGIDAVVGAIPLVGDLFDVGWRANQRNVALLEGWAERPRETRRASSVFVALAVAVVVLLAGAVAFASYSAVAWAVGRVAAG